MFKSADFREGGALHWETIVSLAITSHETSTTAVASPSKAVTTDDGSLTMAHAGHGECYHSLAGAESEARLLYLGVSAIADAWVQSRGVAVLDVGLGLGYNALLTLEAWADAPAPPSLTVHSLEIDAALVAALASGAASWQANWSQRRLQWCQALAPLGNGERGGDLELSIPHGHADAMATWRIHVAAAGERQLPMPPPSGYHYIWQDPFSPARNPDLWTEAWFKALAARAASDGCTLVTYSVARAVREALAKAGWSWRKVAAAQASKRHWLRAERMLNLGSEVEGACPRV